MPFLNLYHEIELSLDKKAKKKKKADKTVFFTQESITYPLTKNKAINKGNTG